MFLSESVFFIILSFVAGIIVLAITTIQSLVTIYIKKNILKQPFSFDFLKKEQIIIFALLEIPLVLGLVCTLYIHKIIYFNLKYSELIISSYLISFLIASYFTTIAFNKTTKNFLSAISSHPQKGGILSGRLIFLFSMLQAPLIISLVTIFINLSSINSLLENNISNFNINSIFLTSMSILSVTISAAGSIFGVKEVIESFGKLSVYFPKVSENIFLNIILAIGFIDAPFIFVFLINLITVSILKTFSSYILYIVGFLVLMFGIVCAFVSYNSGKVINKSFSLMTENYKINKNIISTCLFTQITLEAKMIYMFLIIIVCLTKFNLL